MATISEKDKIMKLSTAEYTTLSTTGTLTKDGVTYTYSPSDTIYVTPDASQNYINYSTTEHLVGKAFGEDLYERTFIIPISELSANGTYDLPAEINHIWSFEVYIYFVDGDATESPNSKTIKRADNYGGTRDFVRCSANDYWYDGEETDNAWLTFEKGTNFNQYYDTYLVTVRYTKRATS